MPRDMTATLVIPDSGSRRKRQLNIAVAAALTALSLWVTIADFSHHGDLLFQTSASGALTALFIVLFFLATLAVAVFPKRWLIGASVLALTSAEWRQGPNVKREALEKIKSKKSLRRDKWLRRTEPDRALPGADLSLAGKSRSKTQKMTRSATPENPRKNNLKN